MSANITSAVEDALAEALSDEGSVATGFIGAVSYLDREGTRCWTVFAPEDQATTVTLGLSRVIDLTAEAQANEAIYGAAE